MAEFRVFSMIFRGLGTLEKVSFPDACLPVQKARKLQAFKFFQEPGFWACRKLVCTTGFKQTILSAARPVLRGAISACQPAAYGFGKYL